MGLALILFLFLLYAFIPKKNSPGAIRSYVTVSTVVMILLSGLRNRAVGNDTYAYLLRFHEIRSFTWREIFAQFWTQYLNPDVTEGKDPGYSVFAKMLSYLTDNEQIYLLVIAMMLFVPFAMLVIRHSSRIEDSLFAFVFYVASYFSYLPNSASRQSLALAFIIIAYMRLEDKREWQFFIYVLIASTFHQSAIGVLLFYPLSKIRNIRIVYLGSLLAFVLMLIFYNQVGAFLASSNAIYDEYEAGGFYARGNARPFMVFFVFLIIYSVGIATLRKSYSLDEKDRLLYIGMGFALAIIPLIWYDPSCIRLNAYFGVYVSCFVPFCLKSYEPDIKKALVFLLYLMLLLKTIRTPFEYKFFWQEMKLHQRYGYFSPQQTQTQTQTPKETYIIS